MPRNGSGTMSVPNSFSSGTTVSSSAMNANFTDVASEITGSLPRDGQAAMTGPFKAASGSVAAPSVTFSSDTDTGFYRKSTGTIGIVADGVEVATAGPTGLVDSNANVISGLPPGVWMMYGATTAPTGWVRLNGRTIGNASSSATERANADTSALFSFLWTNYSNAVCAVSSGRGASAAADYAANKTIALPDMRGRAPFGLDDMGSSRAGRLGSILTTPTTNGAAGGTETVTLTTSEMPAHTHDQGTLDSSAVGDHAHQFAFQTGQAQYGSGQNIISAINAGASTANTSSTGAHDHTLGGSTGSNGSGGAHSNLPPALVTTFIMKL